MNVDVDWISLEIALATVFICLTVFFIGLRSQISSIRKQLDEMLKLDVNRDASLTSIMSNLLMATKHYENVMERFASSARRGDENLRLLTQLTTQMTNLGKDHELVMNTLNLSMERIFDKLPK